MAKNWLSYWKNSLTDSQRLLVDFEREKHFMRKDFNLNDGIVPIDKNEFLFIHQEQKINRKKNITDINDKRWVKLNSINVTCSLFIAIPKVEHLTTSKNSNLAYPFWINAELSSNGQLSIPEEQFPLIPREHLVPSARMDADFILGMI